MSDKVIYTPGKDICPLCHTAVYHNRECIVGALLRENEELRKAHVNAKRKNCIDAGPPTCDMCAAGNPSLCRYVNTKGVMEEIDRLREENRRLRFYLWLKHGDHKHTLYGDDGQQMCNSCLIDFKNDPIDSIVDKFSEQALRHAAGGNNA